MAEMSITVIGKLELGKELNLNKSIFLGYLLQSEIHTYWPVLLTDILSQFNLDSFIYYYYTYIVYDKKAFRRFNSKSIGYFDVLFQSHLSLRLFRSVMYYKYYYTIWKIQQ